MPDRIRFLGRALMSGVDDLGRFHGNHRVTGILVVLAFFGVTVSQTLVLGLFGNLPTILLGLTAIALVVLDGAYIEWHELASRVPKPVIGLAAEVQAGWIHIRVRNDGDTDDFVAQVVDSQPSPEDDQMTHLYSLKWRQSEDESKQIIAGQSVLLDFAEFQIQGFFKGDFEKRARYYCYLIHSTTARVRFGTRVVFEGAMHAHDWTPVVSDEEIANTASLRIEVRGAHHHAIGFAWVHLGYQLDQTLLVRLEVDS